MIWIDYSIIVLVLISSIIGLFRGFISEVFSLFIWITAIWIGLHFSRELATFLEDLTDYPSARMATAFAILFFITLMLGALISFLLGELIKKTGLTGFDRFSGMIFGIARGLVVVSIIIMLAGLTPLPEDKWWKESTLIPPFQRLAVWLRKQIPSGMTEFVNYK